MAAGGEAVTIGSVGESRGIGGVFDRGIFAFDLPDGSGVVLAAEMMRDSRIGEIEFFDPADTPTAHQSAGGSTFGSHVRAHAC